MKINQEERSKTEERVFFHHLSSEHTGCREMFCYYRKREEKKRRGRGMKVGVKSVEERKKRERG